MQLIQKADLTNYSTLRVKSKADSLALPKSIDEVVELFQDIKEKKLNWHVLGAGSNLLLSSRGIDGIVICTNDLDFINKISDTKFEVGSGLRMPRFCAKMTQESLSGTEFMEGIPGSVGGGVVMNAGAHGAEISDILVSVKVFNTESWKTEELSKEDLGFSYRKSNIDPQKHIVLSASFELKPAKKEEIRALVSKNNQARSAHQPIKAWTCGCTFKNPEPEKAGLLIDKLGLKGISEASFSVSKKHGNFFENDTSHEPAGTSIDFCKLMKRVQDTTFNQEGIILCPEVQTMGEFTEEELQIWHPQESLV